MKTPPPETPSGYQTPAPPAAHGEQYRQSVLLAAYHIYLNKGRPEGQALDHWLEAEHRARFENEPSAPV